FLAGWFISLFFTGAGNVLFAPALILLLAAGAFCIVPALWHGRRMPRAGSAVALYAFWLYIALTLPFSTVPFNSLMTCFVFLGMPLAFIGPLLLPAPMRRDALRYVGAGFTLLMAG